MQQITQKDVERLFNDIKVDLFNQFPLNDWAIKPRYFHWTKHKTKYGMANHRGDVYINDAFVSTTAWQLLEATLRHEFAHLYIGLAAGHNARFRKTASLFKSSFKRVPVEEVKQLRDQIRYQYNLFAILANGESVLIKKAHRKHAKYTKYKPRLFYNLSIKGCKIIRFDYIEI